MFNFPQIASQELGFTGDTCISNYELVINDFEDLEIDYNQLKADVLEIDGIELSQSQIQTLKKYEYSVAEDIEEAIANGQIQVSDHYSDYLIQSQF